MDSVRTMLQDHLLILPLLLPLLGALAAVALRGRRAAWPALAAALATLAADGLLLARVAAEGVQVYAVGGWAAPYGIALVADRLGAVLALTAGVVASASVLHTIAAREEPPQRLYQPLLLLLLAALHGVFLTGDLFNLYVNMELVILSSFGLVALADRPASAEVTFKYAVISALGSTLLLASVAVVYAGAGTLAIADIARRAREGAAPPFMGAAAGMMLCAFLLKGAVVPFHFWQPDTHSTAPASMSALLSGVLVKVGVYGIIRMQTLLFPDAAALALLAPLGAASALFGGLAALATQDVKRLLAYSTISNLGLIVLALGWGGRLGLTAALVHTVNHALFKGGLFLAGGYVAERLDEHDLRRLGGLARLTPWGAAAFGLGALALAGIPPLSGFVSKLTLFQAGYAAGDGALLAAAVAASALGVGYSLRGFALIFWGETPAWAAERWRAGDGQGRSPLAPLLLALLALALGLWPEPLVGAAAAAAAELERPGAYIGAVLGGAP